MVSHNSSVSAASPEPLRRVIVLGASNVSRGLPVVRDTARLACGGPVELFLACGRGRSYGIASTFLGRTLPGIVHCGLWSTLEGRPPLPSSSLVTDIGNDLLYEVAVPQIAGWVEECVDRLITLNATPVITALPLENVESLSAARFRFFRTLLYRRCSLSLAEVLDRAVQLNERVRHIAQSRGLTVLEPCGAWYGLDPVHIRFRSVPSAWHEIMSHCGGQGDRLARVDWPAWLRMQLLPPQERRVIGVSRRAAQPAMRLSDGTTLWLY